MTVQMIATPPIVAANAMMTVRVVLVVELAPLLAGTALVGPASEEVMVKTSVL